MTSFETTNLQIRERAAEHPQKIAIRIEDETISYEDLVARVNRLSNYLLGLGIPAQSNVIVYMDRSIENIVAILSVINVGCVYVPIDPVHSSTRVDFIIQDAAPRLILTETALLPELQAPPSCRVIDLWMESDAIASSPATTPSVDVLPDSAMYILYTSGTTGNPKGVVVHHRGVQNLLRSVKSRWPLNETVLQFASLGFDASIPEWAGCLSMGGTLIMIKNRKLTLGNELINLISNYRVSFIKMPSAVLSTLHPGRELPHLKTVVTAGDACTKELVERWAHGREFYNCYGPTEASIGTTMAQCRPGEKVTIGKPHAGIDVYILDEAMKPVAQGETGEIYIGGIAVAFGYHNRPALTAEKFLPDPFSQNGGRLYRTGDLGRFCDNGEIEFIGRIDNQVKLRGFRIELEEINTWLKTYPGISDAACILGSKEEGQEPLLVAFFTTSEGHQAEAAGIKKYLGTKMPEYMIPNELISISEFVFTANGKIDTRYLAEHYKTISKAPVEKAPAEDEDPVSGIIRTAWTNALGSYELNEESDFFDLGGSSLHAASVVAEIEMQLGVAPSIADLYENPRLRSFEALAKQFVKAFESN